MDGHSAPLRRGAGQERAHADGDRAGVGRQPPSDADEARRRSTPPAPPRRRPRSPRGRRRRAARGRRRRRAPAGSAPRRSEVPRASGNVHVHCSGARLPRSRCASAADREQLRGHRAGLAADRHVREHRRDVGPQRAGIDELALEQPLDVGAPPGDDLASDDRDHVGGGAAAVEQDRVGQRARDQQRRRHPVGGRALEAARRALVSGRPARRWWSWRAAGGRAVPAGRPRARAALLLACWRTRRRARRSWSARPGRDRAPAVRRQRRSRRPTPPADATPRTARRRFGPVRRRAPPPPWCWRRRRRARSPGGHVPESGHDKQRCGSCRSSISRAASSCMPAEGSAPITSRCAARWSTAASPCRSHGRCAPSARPAACTSPTSTRSPASRWTWRR